MVHMLVDMFVFLCICYHSKYIGSTPENHPMLTQGFTYFWQGGLCGGSCETEHFFY